MSLHIVFDCDGTLISSMSSVFAGLVKLLSSTLERPVSQKELMENYDSNIDKMFERFQIPLDKKEYLLDQWGKLSSSSQYEYQAYEGIAELLHLLSKQGHSLYVWTARDRYSTVKILTDLGLLRFFEDLKTSTDAPTKPDITALKEMLGDVHPEKVFVIGDSYTDMLGAQNYKAHAIGVTWDIFADEQALKQSGADIIVDSVGKVEGAINKLAKGEK